MSQKPGKDKDGKDSKKTVAAIVYNAKLQALVKSKGGKMTQVTNEELEFLRQAEMDKDIDDDDDDEDMLEQGIDEEEEERKRQERKKQATFTRPRDIKKYEKEKRAEALLKLKPGKSQSTQKSVKRLIQVSKEVQSAGTDSTAEQSADSEESREPAEPTTLFDKWKSIFKKPKPRFKKSIPKGHEYDEYGAEKKDAALHRVTNEEARRIRQKQARKKKCMEHCTYHCLVLVIFVRLVTTLEMVYEHESHYIILEYLKRIRKLNCLEIFESASNFWPLVLIVYFLSCCILPIITRKELSGICIVWMFVQMVYTSTRAFLLQKFIFYREYLAFNQMAYAHTAVDVLSFTVVMIRYYYWANPSSERDRYSNTMLGDYLVNEYIQFMVQSSFIRKKNAVQRATAFQIMTVVRKLKEKYTSSGKGPSNSAIAKEVRSAIHALQDWKKFPALRIIHSFEVKEKIMKEKLRLRRQRIREMKDRFETMMKSQKADNKKGKSTVVNNNNKVVLNPKGQAIGMPGSVPQSTSVKSAEAGSKSTKSNVPNSATTTSITSYGSKRAALLEQTK